MDNRKIIIILLCTIIAILVVGIIVFSPLMAREDSHLAIADKKINAGDKFTVVLTDDDGNTIPNETVKIRLTSKDGNVIEKERTTNSKGKAKLKVEETGKYSAECSFNGNGQYASSSLTDTIKVDKATTELLKQKTSVEFPEYLSKFGSFRTVETQQELAVIETSNGNYYVIAGDGYYTFEGHDSQGHIKLGSRV